jgi:hypothetical protein
MGNYICVGSSCRVLPDRSGRRSLLERSLALPERSLALPERSLALPERSLALPERSLALPERYPGPNTTILNFMMFLNEESKKPPK